MNIENQPIDIEEANRLLAVVEVKFEALITTKPEYQACLKDGAK